MIWAAILPVFLLGSLSIEIRSELGYGEGEVAAMHAAKVVGVWSEGQPLLEGPRRFMGLKPSIYEKPEEIAQEAVDSGEHVAAK